MKDVLDVLQNIWPIGLLLLVILSVLIPERKKK